MCHPIKKFLLLFALIGLAISTAYPMDIKVDKKDQKELALTHVQCASCNTKESHGSHHITLPCNHIYHLNCFKTLVKDQELSPELCCLHPSHRVVIENLSTYKLSSKNRLNEKYAPLFDLETRRILLEKGALTSTNAVKNYAWWHTLNKRIDYGLGIGFLACLLYDQLHGNKSPRLQTWVSKLQTGIVQGFTLHQYFSKFIDTIGSVQKRHYNYENNLTKRKFDSFDAVAKTFPRTVFNKSIGSLLKAETLLGEGLGLATANWYTDPNSANKTLKNWGTELKNACMLSLKGNVGVYGLGMLYTLWKYPASRKALNPLSFGDDLVQI